jgi:hypothetical protein
MKLVGDVTVGLPYTLDFCAKGPDIEPIIFDSNGVEITIFFPPSMSDGTVGQSFFASGWAWWTGTTLRLTMSQNIVGDNLDIEQARASFIEIGNKTLRRLLNSYRVRFHRPHIYPMRIDPKALVLKIEYHTGAAENLPEPFDAFFYQHIPDLAPLESSINLTTLSELAADLAGAGEQSVDEQLLLDAEWLESLQEFDRATAIRDAAAKIRNNIR